MKHITTLVDEKYEKLFLNKIRTVNDCWEWTAHLDVYGYGKFSYKGKVILAHRYSYMLYNGYLDSKLSVCHKCDNPACVNPEHLFLGTHQDNMDDKKKKGRTTKGSGFSHAVMTEQDVVVMRALRNLGFAYSAIAKRFKISEGTAHSAITRRTWRHVA